MTTKRWYARDGVREEVVRVKDTGEVFTPDHIGIAMIDMVLERDPTLIDGNYLDPSCGSGNLLVCVLKKKIEAGIHPYVALWSIFGIEINFDNAKICRQRLVAYAASRVDDPDAHDICEEIMDTVPDSIHPRIVCHDTLKWNTDNWAPQL